MIMISIFPVRRINGFARVFGMGLAIVLSLLLLGCHATSYSSRALAKPAQEIKHIEVVYIENSLRPLGLTAEDKQDEKLADYNYYGLGRLLQERAPLVLKFNGLAGTVTLVPPPRGNAELDLMKLGQGGPVLALEVVGRTDARQGLFMHRTYLKMNAALIDRSADGGRKQLWQGLVNIRLGADEAAGVTYIHRVDAKFADELTVGLLNSLSADGMVRLPQGKATAPKQ